jgi:hypothetical protein
MHRRCPHVLSLAGVSSRVFERCTVSRRNRGALVGVEAISALFAAKFTRGMLIEEGTQWAKITVELAHRRGTSPPAERVGNHAR